MSEQRPDHDPGRSSRLRRLVGHEAVTRPVPVVQRLRGTPYQDPRRPGTQGADTGAREALDLVMRIAVLDLRCGSGTAEVVTAALATAVGLGLEEEHLEIDITNTSIVVGYSPRDLAPVALVRVVSSPGRDAARMSEVHRLVVDLVAGRLDPGGARERLQQVETMPRPYKRAVVTLAWGALSALIVLRLGGGWAAVTTALVATAVVDQVGRQLGRRNVPVFFSTVVGAALATLFALALSYLGDRLAWLGADGTVQAALVLAGGIVVLLPGMALVAAVQDGIRGYPVTATARLFSVLLSTGAILVGVSGVLAVSPVLGTGDVRLDDQLEAVVDLPLWWTLLIVAVGSAAAGLGNRTPPRLVLPVAVAGCAGFGVSAGVVSTGLPDALGAAAGCVVIGLVGRVWALRLVASPLAVVVPAVTMLLPGLTIVEGLRQMTGGSSVTGLVTLLEAGTIGVAIAAGVVLGDHLAAPVERGLDQMTALPGRRNR